MPDGGAERSAPVPARLVGRDAELARVVQVIESSRKQGCVVVAIGGEAGVGKTALAGAAAAEAERRGFRVARGWCLPERLGPLMPVREVMSTLGLAHTLDPGAARVEAVYIIDPSGLLMARSERPGVGGDADILEAMITAVREFSRDAMRTSLGDTGEGRSSGISFGDRRMVVANSNPEGMELIVAALVVGQETTALVASLQRLASEIGDENREWLEKWKGETSAPEPMERRLREFVELPSPAGATGIDDPKLAYLRSLESSISALTREAERAPVIVFIDDAHWADEPTLGWLHHLARSAKDSPLAILMTYRPEETADSPEGLDGTLRLVARESRFERLELAPLPASGVSLLIEAALGGPVNDKEYLERLFRATGGNPLYVIETTRLSVEEKALTRDGVGWRLARDLKSITIPARVRDVVARRVSALSSEERELAETAAVLGEEFTLSLLVEVSARSRTDAARLLDSLERSHRLLHSTSRGYRFRHSILRETLYDAMGAGMKRELHATAAEALERSPARIDRREEMVAWHYAQAGDAERGVPAIVKAAGVMERRYDNAAVSRLCGWGIELLRLGSDGFATADRDAEDGRMTRTREVGLLLTKGEAEFRSGRLVEARSTLEEACALALKEGDFGTLGRASTRLCVTLLNLGDPAKVLEVWVQTSQHLGKERPIDAARLRRHAADALRMIGRLEEAKEEAEAARDGMERAGAGPGELAGAYHTLANVASARGDPAAAVGLYGKGVELLRSIPTLDEDATLLYGLSASAYNCGVSHMMLGQVDEAAALVEDARGIWARLGDEHGLATSLATLGDIAVAKGELEEAERLCAESGTLSERLGDIEGVAMARYHRAGVLYELERPAEALESLDAAASLFEAQGMETVLPSVLATQAKVLLSLGDTVEAGRRLQRATDLVAREASSPARLSVLAATALWHAHNRRFDDSMASFRSALDLASETGLRAMQAEMRFDLGRAFCGLGRTEEGAQLLSESADYYEKAGLRFWADRARTFASR